MRYLMFLLGLMLSGTANAIDCEKTPNCEELGYSKENDPYCADDGYMLCPFDFTFKKCVEKDCAKLGFTTSDKTSWCKEIIKCEGNEDYTLCAKATCDIGDVYYANGSCGKASEYVKDSSPIPVGVVYWVTENKQHGKVINLHDLGKRSSSGAFDPANPYTTIQEKMYWGYSGYDIPELTNYNSSDNMLTQLQDRDPDLYDGKGNTAKILAAAKPKCDYEVNTKGYYQYCIPQAAQAAHDFYPLEELKEDSKVGQGKWYLPALGELMDLYGYDNNQITSDTGTIGANGNTKSTVNATLTTLESKGVTAKTLTNAYYWSSSEYLSSISWGIYMNNGNRNTNNKYAEACVRATLEF